MPRLFASISFLPAVALLCGACVVSDTALEGQLAVFRGMSLHGINGTPASTLPGEIAEKLPPLATEPSAPRRFPEGQRIVPGDVIVRAGQPDVDAQALVGALPAFGLRVRHKGHASRTLHLVAYETDDGTPADEGRTRQIADALSAHDGVLYAEVNSLMFPALAPNDEHYASQWHYPAIHLPDAWDITRGSPDVVVAVIDTGITRHPQLDSRLLPGVDTISDQRNAGDGDGRDSDPTDPGGDLPNGGSTWHGTHVAGTIGAVSNDGEGVAGVDWHARLLPVRVLGKYGGTDFDILAGMTWAVGDAVPGLMPNRNPAHVVNMSLGGHGPASRAYQELIDSAVGRGVVFVVAAGNENSDTAFTRPCNQERVLCVGATRFTGARASYSNHGDEVSVMAPGGQMSEDRSGDGKPDGVLSTYRSPDGRTPTVAFLNGTSMAAPHIAGLVSLMKSVRPTMKLAEVEDSLRRTASPIAGCSGCGAGLVNAYLAVLDAQGGQMEGPARLSLSATRLTLFGDDVSGVDVSNFGGEPLEVSASVSGGAAGHVTLKQSTLTVGPGETARLSVESRTAGLSDVATGTLELETNAGEAQVALRVVPPADPGLLPDAELIAVWEDDLGRWHEEARTKALASEGYRYKLKVKPGDYFLIAAIDLDGNGALMEEGEPVGFYRDLTSIEKVSVNRGETVEGLRFGLVPFGGMSESASAGGP